MKKQVSEQKAVIKQKNQEIDSLKKAYKHTRISELEVDQKVYIEELMRMRNILENVLREKDPLTNPDNLQKYQEDFHKQEEKVKNVKKENLELAEIIKSKEKLIQDQAQQIAERDAKIEKLKVSSKESKVLVQQF